MRSLRVALKRPFVRAARAALVRYVRAEPRPSDLEGADRRVFILLSTAWGMGGTIRTILNMAGHLAAQGYEVELLSVGRGRNKPFFGEFPPGVSVVALDDKRKTARHGRFEQLLRGRNSVLIHPRDRVARGMNLWVDLQLVRRLRRRCGFLVTTRPGLNMVAATLSPPGLALIGQEHMNLSKHPDVLVAAMPRHYRKLDALMVLTEGDRRSYRRYLKRRVPVLRVPNSVRDMGSARADLSARTVLAAGRYSPQKGYDLLIRAWVQVAERHPDWTLKICGNGPKRELLEGLVAEHGLGDVVTLAPPARDLGSEMSRASVYALSSRFEGLPLVLLEAMGKGMSVISFDCPTGPRDVIDDHRNGLLIPPKDVDAFAAGLLELIEDEDLRRGCAAAAIETAAEYTIEAVGQQWEELLGDVWERRAAALTA